MTAEAEHGQPPRGAPSPANHKPHMKLRSTASTLAPSRPDFLNSLGYGPTIAEASGGVRFMPFSGRGRLIAILTFSRRTDCLTGPAKVIDGDTIVVAEQLVRLHGIDAPKLDQTFWWWGQQIACGTMSLAALEALIAGVKVRCEVIERDRHGRLVAKVYSPNGVDIGRRLVSAGWALAYRRYSKDYVDAENAGPQGEARDVARHLRAPLDVARGESTAAHQKFPKSGMTDAYGPFDGGQWRVSGPSERASSDRSKVQCDADRPPGRAVASDLVLFDEVSQDERPRRLLHRAIVADQPPWPASLPSAAVARANLVGGLVVDRRAPDDVAVLEAVARDVPRALDHARRRACPR